MPEMLPGDRVLVIGQRGRRRRFIDWLLRRPKPQSENGIYVVASEPWGRP